MRGCGLHLVKVVFCLVLIFSAPLCAIGQAPDTKGSILLTVFLKHDQTKTLKEINDHLEATGFWKDFPP